jgi:hypothetical protein
VESLLEFAAQILFAGWELAVDLAYDRYGWRGSLPILLGPLAVVGLIIAILAN